MMRTTITSIPVAVALLATAACGEATGPTHADTTSSGLQHLLEIGPAMVESADVRRKVLEESLVDPTNGYSALRLSNYGLGDEGWDVLPVRNFPVRVTMTDDLASFVDEPFRRSGGTFRPVFDAEEFEWTDEHLRELGKRAFHRYPLNTDRTLAAAFDSREAADASGLWETSDGRLGGFVRARTVGEMEVFASTCASCHASVVDGALVDGRTNAAMDRHHMVRRYHGMQGSDWGPGAVDVTPDGEANPVAITDLRPVRHQNRLHWAGTLYNSPEALAVRVETLMITSARKGMRPPREVAIAVAYYLWSLGEDVTPSEHSPGAEVFDRNCSTCHHSDGTTAPPVDVELIGTDPVAGRSTMRGTGTYRIPSLHRVGDRTQYLHEGRVHSLEELFDPARLDAVPGHVYGTNLSESERTDLIEFLRTL